MSGYQTWDPQEKLLTKNGTESITLNSVYYPESYNEVFKQLLLSEQVWIFYEDYLLGAVVKSSSLKYKNRLSDMLINYTIDFDFAFDTINNIR